MATVGFSASEQDKKHIDELADSFVKEHGGNKADFLAAMVSAYESSKARQELPGRVDEINHVENLLGGLRTAYMSSLAMAKAAKIEASEAVEAEINKFGAIQSTLQGNIDRLTAENKALSEQVVKGEEISKQYDAVRLQLIGEQDTVKILRSTVQELTSKIESMGAAVAKSGEFTERIRQLEQENTVLHNKITVMEEEKSKICREYEEKAKLASEKAANEQEAAVLAVKREYAEKVDSLQGIYHKRIAELLLLGKVENSDSNDEN